MIVHRSHVQFRRLLDLDRHIRSGKYRNCGWLATELEVNEKTIRRDIEYLRDRLGAPLEYNHARKGYFYTDGHWFLPALSLSEGDLFAVLLASRVLEQYRGTPVAKELAGVFQKIAAALPDKLTIRPELIYNRFSFSGPPAKPVDPKLWATVVRGLLHQRSVQITYRAIESKQDKPRLIDPYHIANLQGEWYVFAHDHRANALSQFAIPRIKQAALTGKHFDLPADFDPDKFLSTTFGRFALGDKVEQVTLLFDKEVASWVLEREWHPKQTTTHLADGRIELAFPATTTGLFEVFRWVLAWGRHVTVVKPAELKQMVMDEIRAIGKLPTGQDEPNA